MNKIKQNKITFSFILLAIAITFSSLSILSLPVLFNYKSKVTIIEKNFYQSFKIYLNASGSIKYKPLPKPHLIVENASLNLNQNSENNDFINTSNLKIFISLRDIYLRSFENIISTKISNTNFNLKIDDLKKIREHLYKKINNPIIFYDCKIFIKNKKDEVILISPIKKINYKINNKTKIKNFSIEGLIFGIEFNSNWKRDYTTPKNSFHVVKTFNPGIEIKNIFESQTINKFSTSTEIDYHQDKLEYDIEFNNNKIKITSPDKNNLNFIINSDIQLNPFFFNGDVTIKNKKIENIIDNILIYLFYQNDEFLGNLNGNLKIKFKDLENKLIKNGEFDFIINEKKINIKKAKFLLDKIGEISTDIDFVENQGVIKFISKNNLNVNDHIEFAKVFQISSKKAKKIRNIYFELERNIGDNDFTISNVKINDLKQNKTKDKLFIVKNIQNLRAYVRQVID